MEAPDDSIAAVARALGWEVIGNCAGGEFGATEVRRVDERAVLKLFGPERTKELEQSIDIASRARANGQLVPEYLGVGVAEGSAYTLQRWCDGDVPDRFEVRHAAQLLDLLETHRGAAPRSDYTKRVREGLRTDTRPWPVRPAIDAAGGLASQLLAEIEELDRVLPEVQLPSGDAVHGDYHHRNFLADEAGTVTAVFDWEGARAGDRRADAFRLLYWSSLSSSDEDRATGAYIRTRVEPLFSAEELALYAANNTLGVLDFYCRERPEHVPWFTESCAGGIAPWWRGFIGD